MRAEAKMISGLVGLAIVLIMWIVQKVRQKLNSKNAVTTVKAEIVDKWEQRYKGSRSCHVSFLTERDERLEFTVSGTEYDAYHMGDRGPLSYRTWEFVSFRPGPRRSWENDVPVSFADEEQEE